MAHALWPAFAPLAPQLLSLIQPVHDIVLSAALTVMAAIASTMARRTKPLIAFRILNFLRFIFVEADRNLSGKFLRLGNTSPRMNRPRGFQESNCAIHPLN
jgi:hypothetical protein